MSRYVQIELPDGSTVVIESDEAESGVVKAGVRDVGKITCEKLEGAAENARKAALVVLDKLREPIDSPDEIEITFGLKASGELGGLVVAKAGVEASFGVKLTWKKLSSKE